MALATWWRGDTMPALSLLPGFRVEASRDEHLIAQINRLALGEVRQRLRTGHQPYLAYLIRRRLDMAGWRRRKLRSAS